MTKIYVKNIEDVEKDVSDVTKEKYMELIRDKEGYVNFKYTPVHLSPKKYKEFYTELGMKIIDDIKKYYYDVEIMEERFPPPMEMDTVAATFYDDGLLIFISKKGWDDLRKYYMTDRRKDSSLPKWSEIKKYYIVDVLIHEFAHVIMYAKNMENIKGIKKYESKIDKENEKEKPNQKRVERLYSKINRIEHGRKFKKIYKALYRKYKLNGANEVISFAHMIKIGYVHKK
jgi:hypothetical protein